MDRSRRTASLLGRLKDALTVAQTRPGLSARLRQRLLAQYLMALEAVEDAQLGRRSAEDAALVAEKFLAAVAKAR